MAINLMDKHSKKLVDAFYLDSVILGKTNKGYDWDGVKSIKVHTITTVEPGTYNRTATANRYGTPTEVQDTEQILSVTLDISNILLVDKGNNTEQMGIKNAGEVSRRQIREQYVPYFDKYALKTWANYKGVQSGVDATVDATNVVKAILKARTALVNKKAFVKDKMFLYVGSTTYSALLETKEFLGLEKLGTEALESGVVGKIYGMKVVEVPDDYLPTGNNSNKANFMVVNKDCVLAPLKFRDLNLHINPPGISGHEIDIRWLGDAFVLDAKKDGVYVSFNKAQTAETK